MKSNWLRVVKVLVWTVAQLVFFLHNFEFKLSHKDMKKNITVSKPGEFTDEGLPEITTPKKLVNSGLNSS